MKFILIRHGERQYTDTKDFITRRSVCLNVNGIKQVGHLGKFLRSNYPSLINSKFIYSSQFARTVQSAEIIRNIFEVEEVQVKIGLQEYYVFNDYNTPKDIQDQYKLNSYRDYDWISPQAGQSLNQACDIFQQTLNDIAIQEDNKEYAVVVTHGGIIRSFCYRLDRSIKPTEDKILNAELIYGGYTIVENTGKQFKILAFDKQP